MNATPFVESFACRSRAHCAACQDASEEGRAFRLSLLAGGFAGLPENGDVLPCPHGMKPAQPATLGAKLARGVKGLAKAAAGVDRAPDDVIAQRQATCSACEQGAGRALCGVCGCLLAAKLRVASESCPLDPPKWGATPPA